MAHLFESGFTVREPAWHRLGLVLDEAPKTWDDGRKVAGLEWEPERHPVFAFSGLTADGEWTSDPAKAVEDPALRSFTEVKEYSQILRSDSKALLAVTTATREVINHTDMGEAVDTIVGMDNVSLDTMGVLDGGKTVYATLLLDEPFRIKGDNSLTVPFMTAINHHDSGAFRIGFNDFRVLCANTVQAAEMAQDARGGYYVFSHTVNWKEQVQQAKEAIAGLRVAKGAYVKEMNELADMRVDIRQTESFISQFISLPAFGATSRVEKNALAARQAIRETLDSVTCAEIKHTAYGLVMAATEYLDHLRGTKGNRNLSVVKRQIITPNSAKTKAITLAREVALAGV